MSTKTEQKQKEKPEVVWRDIFEQIKTSLRNNAAVKAGLVQECCMLLESAGMPLEMICGRVVYELREFIDRKYMYSVIDKKYKDADKGPRKNKEPEQSIRDKKPDDHKKDLEEKTMELIQTVSGDNGDPQIEISGPREIVDPENIEDYRIDQLEDYSKKFLINLVIYLHNKVQSQKPVSKRNK